MPSVAGRFCFLKEDRLCVVVTVMGLFAATNGMWLLLVVLLVDDSCVRRLPQRAHVGLSESTFG